jgi:hypothetical protein
VLHRAPRERRPDKQVSKRFFFEKKKQKTFLSYTSGCFTCAAQGTKVFWFFFSKKNFFLKG